MRKEFSKKWIASRQIRKQRKYRANAHITIKKKMMASNLNKDLRKRYSRKSMAVRKGDSIKVMRGEFKGKTGKISIIDLMRMKVAIEGIQITKKDGTKINVFFQPSNLQIQELNLDDKKRFQSIEKTNKEEKK